MGHIPMYTSLVRQRIAMAAALATATALAACGGGGGSGGSGSSSVVIDELVPLTGPSADIGPQDDIPGFTAAQAAINAAGGILGKKLTLVQTDLGADPADSVTNTRQMLAANSGLSGVVGLTSDTAVVSANVLESSHIVCITQAGTLQLDHYKSKYIFRLFPPDSTNSVAMAAVALKKGYTHAALLIGQNSGSQSVIPPLQASYTKHGGTIVDNEVLPLDQTSYQVELAKMIAAKPDVIFYETDEQTAATIFSELKTLNNLSIPIIGTSATGTGPFWQTASQAVGGYAEMAKFFVDVNAPSQYSGAGYQTFKKYYSKLYPSDTPNVYLAGNYDSVVVMALAMTMANSTDPTVYVADIPKVVADHSATSVTNYADGVAAIKAGKSFYYNGTLGPVSFDQYHSIAGEYVVEQSLPDGSGFHTIQDVPNDVVAAYE
ncbi:MAG: ABC transporter substrate-binding protein [Candidatus Dormibacteria bacterium]